jgi:hypothetical protein
MSGPPPSHDNATAVKPTSGTSTEDSPTSTSTAEYERSTALAQQKLKNCRQLLTFSQYLRNHSLYVQRSAGQQPSAEDRESFAALGRQWRDLLDGKLLEGVGDVLTEAFRDEAESELGKIDCSDKNEAAIKAREVWKEVVELIAECKDIRREMDELVAKMS